LSPGSALAAVIALAAGAFTAGVSPGPQPHDPTDFLRQLEGDWLVVTEATLGPGQEPIRSESRKAARMVGRWLVAESEGIAANGRPFTSILTLGYDPHEERFVGTWIDSMQAHMWSYHGTLDEPGTVLTLATEGPILGDPTRIAQYRELIEVVDADHALIRSMILGPDGEWFEFARAEHRRDPHPTEQGPQPAQNWNR
jgi:hypothetical protein